MNIVLIGAGNVATHLGPALQEAGETIVQIYSRTAASAAPLAARMKVPYTTSLDALVDDADLYCVMLADEALLQLIPAIVKGREKALFVHTAGSVPLSVWKGYAARCGVLYPMQTFSKQRPLNFKEVPLFVEASDGPSLDLLMQLAGCLSRHLFQLDSEQRKWLHLGAVFACNFTNNLYAACARILKEENIPFSVMLPLIGETVGKLSRMTPLEAQTGPALRRDSHVMASQLSLLEQMASEPRLAAIYKLLSDNIIEYDQLRPEQD